MTLFISSKYIPEILSMKQQNQLIQYWKDTSTLIEPNQPIQYEVRVREQFIIHKKQ